MAYSRLPWSCAQSEPLVGDYERDVIRPNALGKFHDLLAATAKSPAMLFYLDNWLSVDPNADLARRQPQRPRRGLNENYARELMELHTLGVDGGYTQKDVTEVARCFTGWTLRNPAQGGGFLFIDSLHDNGAKMVLGARIPAGGGIRDGELVLDLLSKHPSTARFISTELCRKFVSDQPPRSLIKRCATTFKKSDGDIRQVLEVIFSSPEFYAREAYRAKIKTPFELVTSALRATGAETTAPPMLFGMLRNMGEMLYGCQPPTGYPDTADAWVSTGSLLARMNFASLLAASRIPHTQVQRTSTAESQAAGSAHAIAQAARQLLGGAWDRQLVESIEKDSELQAGTVHGETTNTAVALILGSPAFQRR